MQADWIEGEVGEEENSVDEEKNRVNVHELDREVDHEDDGVGTYKVVGDKVSAQSHKPSSALNPVSNDSARIRWQASGLGRREVDIVLDVSVIFEEERIDKVDDIVSVRCY